MKTLCMVLAVSTLTYTISPNLSAQQERPSRASGLTDQEEQDFAAREADSPDLASFEAGDALGLLITVLVIVALVALIWWLLDYHHHYKTEPMPVLNP